jgi:hypothetical protein
MYIYTYIYFISPCKSKRPGRAHQKEAAQKQHLLGVGAENGSAGKAHHKKLKKNLPSDKPYFSIQIATKRCL